MSDGEKFDIERPDLCMVSQSEVYVGAPDPELQSVAMRVTHCALIHITQIEPLNGQRRTRKKQG